MNYLTHQERLAKNPLAPHMDFWEELAIARQKKEDRVTKVYDIVMSAMFVGLPVLALTIWLLV